MSSFRHILKRILITAGLIALVFLLQESVFPHLALGGITPNCIIILVCFAGFSSGALEGMLVGFFSGILLDLMHGQWFGMYALLYLYIGFLNGSFRKFFFGEDLKLPLLFTGLSDIIYGFVIYFFIFFTRQKTDVLFYIRSIIIPEAVYTMVVMIALYVPLLLIYNFMGKQKQRETKIIV